MPMRALTYSNLLWDSYMADPFVIKHRGEFWAYGTSDQQRDGRWFPVLHSTDLGGLAYHRRTVRPLPSSPLRRTYVRAADA